jgi:predicted lactoylglutathione lyase
MIAYTCLGTNDLEKAGRFYDALLGTIGAGRAMEVDGRFVAWGKAKGQPLFAMNKPFDGEAATVGNGVMVSLGMSSRDEVDAIYKKALELGSVCEGEPGERAPTFYAAYFRDLDGNKLCACSFS